MESASKTKVEPKSSDIPDGATAGAAQATINESFVPTDVLPDISMLEDPARAEPVCANEAAQIPSIGPVRAPELDVVDPQTRHLETGSALGDPEITQQEHDPEQAESQESPRATDEVPVPNVMVEDNVVYKFAGADATQSRTDPTAAASPLHRTPETPQIVVVDSDKGAHSGSGIIPTPTLKPKNLPLFVAMPASSSRKRSHPQDAEEMELDENGSDSDFRDFNEAFTNALQVSSESDNRRTTIEISEKFWRTQENKTLAVEFGLPDTGALFQDENYVLSYSRERRIPSWIARYLKRDHLKGYLAACLALDHSREKLYWSDFNREELHVIDLRTSRDKLLVSQYRVAGIALLGNYVYFTHKLPADNAGNTPGSVIRMNPDGKNVEAIGAHPDLSQGLLAVTEFVREPMLLVGTNSGINCVSMIDSEQKHFIPALGEVIALALDCKQDLVFYSTNSHEIRRCASSGQGDTLIVSDVYAYGLDVDNENRKLYWSNREVRSKRCIMIANYDGSDSELLDVGDKPSAIRVDMFKRVIYWTEGDTGDIRSVSMDTADKETMNKRGCGERMQGECYFVPDPQVDPKYQVGKRHYKKAHDRYSVSKGHGVPASHCVWDQKVLNRTFRFSQVFPQHVALNNGLWRDLEQKCSLLANAYGGVIIVAVTLFLPKEFKPCQSCDLYPCDTKYHDPKSTSPYSDFWLRNRVLGDVHGPHVPTDCAMIFLVLESSGKINDADDGRPIAVGAYQMPNTKPSKVLGDYKTTVGAIEKNAGLRLFDRLGIDIDRDLRAADTLPEWNGNNKRNVDGLRVQT